MKTLCFIFILGKNLWHVVSFILCYILSLSSANSYVHWISNWIHLKLIIYDIMSNYMLNGYKNWLCSVSTECLWGKSVSLMYIIFIILRNFHSFIIHIFMILGGLNLQVSDFLWTPLNEYLSNEHFAVYMSSSTVCVNDWILLLIMDDHGYVCWRFNVCV